MDGKPTWTVLHDSCLINIQHSLLKVGFLRSLVEQPLADRLNDPLTSRENQPIEGVRAVLAPHLRELVLALLEKASFTSRGEAIWPFWGRQSR
jgi:hypothetical protein